MNDQAEILSSRLRAIGAALCAAGRLDSQSLKRAERVAEESAERLDRVLCRLGMVSERDMAGALAEALGVPRIGPEAFPAEAVLRDELGPQFLGDALILPLEDGPERVRLAVADPINRSGPEAVALKLGRPVEIAVALPSEIEGAIERLYGGAESAELEADIGEDDTAADVARLKDLASEAPVIRLVNRIIRKAADAGASDIHFEPFDQSLRVRLRVDGELQEIEAPPGALRSAIVSRLKIMAKLNIAEQRLPQDGRIQVTIAGREIDMRVATVPTLHGEGVVLRLLDRSGLVLDLEGLGFDAETLAALVPLIERPNGILLVTGPTGSGKTTT
ncbi:MAG: ATPase, T2SS/T4P/T4SS family, partial [Pseudomonadota bacterium]